MNKETKQVIHPTREELEDYLQALIPELNLRLLTEKPEMEHPDLWETFLVPERILVIESITITGYEPGRTRSTAEKIRSAGSQLIKRLMERAGNFRQKIWNLGKPADYKK